MVGSILLRTLAFLCFAAFGVVWSSTHAQSWAILWVVSFAVLVLLSLWYAIPDEDRGGLGSSLERVPGFSKNPDDYR